MKRMKEYEDGRKNLALRMMALSQLDPALYEEMLKVLPVELSHQVREHVESMKILCQVESESPAITLAKYAESNG